MSSPSPRSLPSGLYVRGIVVGCGEDVFARALFVVKDEAWKVDTRIRD